MPHLSQRLLQVGAQDVGERAAINDQLPHMQRMQHRPICTRMQASVTSLVVLSMLCTPIRPLQTPPEGSDDLARLPTSAKPPRSQDKGVRRGSTVCTFVGAGPLVPADGLVLRVQVPQQLLQARGGFLAAARVADEQRVRVADQLACDRDVDRGLLLVPRDDPNLQARARCFVTSLQGHALGFALQGPHCTEHNCTWHPPGLHGRPLTAMHAGCKHFSGSSNDGPEDVCQQQG